MMRHTDRPMNRATIARTIHSHFMTIMTRRASRLNARLTDDEERAKNARIAHNNRTWKCYDLTQSCSASDKHGPTYIISRLAYPASIPIFFTRTDQRLQSLTECASLKASDSDPPCPPFRCS